MAGVFAVMISTAAMAAEIAVPDSSWKPAIMIAPGRAPVDDSSEVPTFEALQASVGADDSVAALEAVQRALDEVGDGAAYVWHRQTGPLWGVVRPLATQRNAAGWPCRRLSVALSLGEHTRSTEVTACRAPDKRWWLTS
jgi:hypothetical protein